VRHPIAGRPGRHLVFVAVLLALAGTRPLNAQVRFAGRVIEDGNLEAIAAARVSFFDLYDRFLGAVTTGRDGRFQFNVEKTPAVRIRVQRIGYKETLTPLLRFDNRTSFEVEVRLRTDAVLVAPLEVTGASGTGGNPYFSGFEHRRKTGSGVYFSRADVERRKPALITDLIATVSGVHVSGSGSGNRRVITMGRTQCPAQLYIDGFFVNVAGAMTLDEVVAPGDVEGIEIYHGLGSVPAEFMSGQARCGVIVVWTKRT